MWLFCQLTSLREAVFLAHAYWTVTVAYEINLTFLNYRSIWKEELCRYVRMFSSQIAGKLLINNDEKFEVVLKQVAFKDRIQSLHSLAHFINSRYKEICI